MKEELLKKLQTMKTNEKKIVPELKDYFTEWSKGTTVHGYPNIFRTNNTSTKTLWIVLLLLSTILCSFMIIESIMDYLSFDVVTQIRVIAETPAEFPTITICNSNPFNTNASYDLMTGIYLNKTDQNLNLFYNQAKNPSFGDENRHLLSANISDMIVYCEFSYEKCNYADFSRFYMTNYGNCYRFNSGFNLSDHKVPIKKMKRGGYSSSFDIHLFLHEDIRFPINENHTSFRVNIENSTYIPSIFSNIIQIKPGVHTEIQLKKVIKSKLPAPYSDCQEKYPNELLFSEKLRAMPYKEEYCVLLCLQKKTNERCNCYDLWYPFYDERFEPCLNESQSSCSDNLFYEMYEQDQIAFCTNICKAECTSISYDISSSYADFPSKKYYESLRENELIKKNFANEGIQNFTFEDLKSKMTSLRVYFSELSYTMISENEKMNIVDLLSNIGGTMGLFLGISLLSFVEIVELVIESCFIYMKYKSNKKTKNADINHFAYV
jgi:hypothetical protein